MGPTITAGNVREFEESLRQLRANYMNLVRELYSDEGTLEIWNSHYHWAARDPADLIRIMATLDTRLREYRAAEQQKGLALAA